MDPIADMLIRIKNAQMARLETALIPHSKIKLEIAKILKKENWIADFSKKGKKSRKFIEIALKYSGNDPKITDVKRMSKPSRRMYIGAGDIKSVRQGYGFAIISTPQGLLTDKEAKIKHIGGELLCQIW